MPRYKVSGVDQATNKACVRVYDARDEASATKLAFGDRMLVETNKIVQMPEPRQRKPMCQLCGGFMKPKKITIDQTSGLAKALICFAIGVILTLTFFGAVIGVPLMIVSLFMGGRRQKILRCVDCGATANR